MTARDKLADVIEEAIDRVHDMDVTHRDYAEAAADAVLGMVVPLEWLGGGSRYHAGDYVIEDISSPRREIRRLLRASFGTQYICDFSGDRPIEAAKAAAYAHHRAQILAAMGLGEGEGQT